jgi:ribonuclease H / adenosylcobalamin/alpha-ribazole phosphatase
VTLAPGVRVIVEADGGSRGNPGPGGFGALVRDPLTGSVLAERSGALPQTTNNAAEYSGLVAGLSAAAALGAREVLVRMDSKLVIEQMSGRWQIKAPGLRPYAAQAATLVRQFARVDFEWVPRSRNTDADALANQAMDAAVDEVASTGPPTIGSWAPRTSRPTRFVLVRHGATEYTAQRRYSGRGDVPLSVVGSGQAERLGPRIAAMVGGNLPAAIVSSPLSRCTQTADAIAAALSEPVPVRIEAGLIECDFGQWEGKTFTEVQAKWPDDLTRWLESTAIAPPGGESFAQVADRVAQVAAGLRDAYPGQVLIVVSHVSPIKVVLRDALAAGDLFLHRMHLDAAGISIVDWWPDGGVSVRLINDTAHLS